VEAGTGRINIISYASMLTGHDECNKLHHSSCSPLLSPVANDPLQHSGDATKYKSLLTRSAYKSWRGGTTIYTTGMENSSEERGGPDHLQYKAKEHAATNKE